MHRIVLYVLLAYVTIFTAYGQNTGKEAFFNKFNQVLSKNLVGTFSHERYFDTICVSRMLGLKFKINVQGKLGTVIASKGTPKTLEQTLRRIIEKTFEDLASQKVFLMLPKSETFLLPMLFTIEKYDCQEHITANGLKENVLNVFDFPDTAKKQIISGTLLSTVVMDFFKVK